MEENKVLTQENEATEAAQPAKKKMNIFVKIILILVAAVAVLYIGFIAFIKITDITMDRKAKKAGMSMGSISEVFGGTDFDGNAITAENLKSSKLTVLSIWATDCHWCIKEMPILTELAQEYAPEDVQFIGVCDGSLGTKCNLMTGDQYDAFLAEAKQLAADNGGSGYTQMAPSSDFINQVINSVAVAHPCTIILDSEGNVLKVSMGYEEKPAWNTNIDTLLAGM